MGVRKSGYLCTEIRMRTAGLWQRTLIYVYMRKILYHSLFVLLCVAMTGCTTVKNIPYLKNAEQVDFTASRILHDSRIMPKDALTINISTTEPAVSRPFNLTDQGGNTGGNGRVPYLVDNEGNIEMPVLGKLHVAGLTKQECQNLIAGRMKSYLSDTENPIVTVTMSSYHVTVLGEVGGGGVIPVTMEKMNILEALASAGDLTMFGRRDNIMLIRMDEHGERTVHRLNINDANIINSPYFYVQQNDIIYVEPLKVKARNTFFNQYTSLWMSLVGICMTAASIVITVTK